MNYLRRLVYSFRLFWGGLLEQPQPVRVGMLDTGELALVDERGQTQLLSVRTTQVIRRTLEQHPRPMVGPWSATDPVHSILRDAHLSDGQQPGARGTR